MANEPRQPSDPAAGRSSGVASADVDPVSDATLSTAVRSSSAADWSDLLRWASGLVETIARDHPSQHVTVFVPDESVGGLRLAAQIRAANDDAGDVIVGEWVVPFDGSVCGRVYRTGAGALVADVSLDADYRGFPGGRSRSSLTVPVGPADDVVAVVNVEAPWVGAFSVRDYDRLTERSSAAFATVPRRQVA